VLARAEAVRTSSETVLPGHMLFALAFGSGHLAKMLQEYGVTAESVRQKLPTALGTTEPTDVPFSSELTDLLNFASGLSESDPLQQVKTEHVLKALLQEGATFSVVDLLKDLSVDLKALKARIDIIADLMVRPEAAENSFETTEVGCASYDKYFSRLASVSGEGFSQGFFDKRTGAIIREAKIFSRLLDPHPSIPEWRRPGQVSTTPEPSELSELGIHHLLSAFRKQHLLSEHVSKIVAIVDYDHLIDMLVDAKFDELNKLREDAQSAMLSARLLANNTVDGLVTPLMLLYGISNQFDSILYINADLEQLGQVAQEIRQELAASLGKIDTRLLMTQRLTRALRLAKTEALLAHHPIVRAPT
jgi:Clp amino terminal domain, pathogenicity island component